MYELATLKNSSVNKVYVSVSMKHGLRTSD